MGFFRKRKKNNFYYLGQEIRLDLKPTSIRPKDVEKNHNRILVVTSMFSLAFLIITVRLIDITMPNKNRETHIEQTATLNTKRVKRADIVDRNGIIIATSLPTVNLYAIPKSVFNPEMAVKKLTEVLPDLDYQTILQRVKSSRSFVYIKRNLTPRQQFEVNRLGLPGFDFENGETRVYPQGALLSHIVGLTNIENLGISGIERNFNDKLMSEDKPLKLSIDIRVQNTTRAILNENIKKFDAAGGLAVITDVNTGEIVAMVSLPDFDPNHFSSADNDAIFNKATLGVFELGSIFKIFNTALALESGKVKIDDRFDASKPLQLARFKISDSKMINRKISVPEVMVFSSNIASVQMALNVGTTLQRNFFEDLGLTQRLNLEIPEVGTPLVPSPWREINTATISYGYGISVTPLHAVAATSAIINGGKYISPTLIAKEAGDEIYQRQVLSEETSIMMRAIMRLVVTDGSGKGANIFGYDVGGKTGSALKVDNKGGYNDKTITSFVAGFPMDNPKYAIIVMLDEPKATKETYGFNTAGWNAAPTAGQIIAKVAPQLNLKPKRQPSTTAFQYLVSTSR